MIRTTCKRLRISDGLRPDFSRKSHRVKALGSLAQGAIDVDLKHCPDQGTGR
jgi:hypothetical protein